jgi:hypothetical protein
LAGKTPATIPNDDRILARWTRLNERWTECKAAVLSPWKLLKGDLRYQQPRLKSEHDAMLARRRKNHDAATTAAKARWEQVSAMRDACVTHPTRSADAMPNDANSSSIPIPKKEDIPDSLRSPDFLKAWEDWKVHRREKKRPLTALSREKQLKALGVWGVGRSVAAIEHSIANGYQGIFEPGRSNGQHQSSAFERKQAEARRLLEARK